MMRDWDKIRRQLKAKKSFSPIASFKPSKKKGGWRLKKRRKPPGEPKLWQFRQLPRNDL